MILAEIDPIQIAIIVIAMLGGFVQWIWSLIKQSQEEAARAKAPPSTEEQKLREAAWKKQVQAPNSPPPPLPKPLTPQAPTSPNDPWAAAREIFEQIKKEATGQTQLPPMAPQRPASAKKAPAYVPPALPTPQVVAVVPVNPPSAPVTHATPAAKVASDRQDGLELLRGLLASPTTIRQAVLMREILGPPKALQTSADSPF